MCQASRSRPARSSRSAARDVGSPRPTRNSSSAFAPKHYPRAIIDYANTRGADKVLYAGYFPMGLSLERIVTELRDVGFRDHVWPKFLRGNAARVLGLDES